jgi:hypothetical protein
MICHLRIVYISDFHMAHIERFRDLLLIKRSLSTEFLVLVCFDDSS